ncbi:MAG: hypothetical protein ILA04_05605 [Prevotella sp.]|nr:hypothetical protein [Prevotella sp.]
MRGKIGGEPGNWARRQAEKREKIVGGGEKVEKKEGIRKREREGKERKGREEEEEEGRRKKEKREEERGKKSWKEEEQNPWLVFQAHGFWRLWGCRRKIAASTDDLRRFLSYTPNRVGFTSLFLRLP